MIDMFSEAVPDCMVQEIPHLEISSDDPSVDIREQLLIFFRELGTTNISMGGSASSLLSDTDKVLFESFETNFWTAATREPSKPLTLIMPCKLFMRSLEFRQDKAPKAEA